MRIAFDATSIGSQLGGDETLTRSLLRGLAIVTTEADRVLVLAATGAELPAEVTSSERFVVDRVTRSGGPVHFGWALPRWLDGLVRRGDRPDVVVSMTHAPLRSPAPVALMVTDLSFVHVPDAYPRRTRWRLNTLVRRQVHQVASVLTISDFCRRDLMAVYGLAEDKVHVVPLVIDPPGPVDPQARSDLAARGVRRPYLLYLGNLHPRKNVPLAISEFRAARAEDPALAEHSFVIAGRRWFGSDAETRAAAGADPGEIVFLDRVSNTEREVLLRDADALVYLSTFEGFGLPPLEAMARGTVVLASRRTAIPEVCGEAAHLVDPEDHVQVRQGLRTVLGDAEVRAGLVRAGHARVADFSDAATGRALLAALGGRDPARQA